MWWMRAHVMLPRILNIFKIVFLAHHFIKLIINCNFPPCRKMVASEIAFIIRFKLILYWVLNYLFSTFLFIENLILMNNEISEVNFFNYSPKRRFLSRNFFFFKWIMLVYAEVKIALKSWKYTVLSIEFGSHSGLYVLYFKTVSHTSVRSTKDHVSLRLLRIII